MSNWEAEARALSRVKALKLRMQNLHMVSIASLIVAVPSFLIILGMQMNTPIDLTGANE